MDDLNVKAFEGEMNMYCRTLVVFLATSLVLTGLAPALAKPAKCFTTQDGAYNCNFIEIDGDGSFRISAKGYRSYTLEMMGSGAAKGSIRTEDGSVPLPGTYERSAEDGACWESADSGDKICAW